MRRLPRRKAPQNVGAECALANQLDKVADHWQRDIRFDQCALDIPNSILNVVFRQPPSTANLIEDTTQPFTESVKHDHEPA